MSALAGWTTFARIGWLGNGCFFGRWVLQWIAAERSGSNRAPELFWIISLLGSALVGTYAAQRGEPVLVAGFVANGAIYLRNLRIVRGGPSARGLATLPASVVAVLAGVILLAAALHEEASATSTAWLWISCAAVGQCLWSSRFVLQWWYSERAGESYFPPAFWALSLVGNVLLLAYAIHLADAVLITGLLPGPLMQIRNLMLARAAASSAVAEPSGRPPTASLVLP